MFQRRFGRAGARPASAVVVAALAMVVATVVPAGAATYDDPAFYDETYLSGFSGPVQMEWLPDGRLLVAEQSGLVKMVDGDAVLGTPFIDIRDQVNGIRDRGLLGIAAHPDFPSQPYVYLLFTYDPPETAGQTGNAGPNGRGARVSRLIRVTADAATNHSTAVAGSEVVLMGTNSTAATVGNLGAGMNDLSQTTCTNPDGSSVRDCLPADSESHTIGSVRFGTDGFLYVGNGDASSYTQVDSRALRALDVDSMAGKIFRIDPITGQAAPGNPFHNGDPDANRSKVWIMGLRNPFRFNVDPFDGGLWIGDVGWGTWEEINHGSAGRDFGWPCYEGGSGTSVPQSGYSGLAECTAYYNSNSATAADYAWNRSGQGGAALAGTVYTGSEYPAQYQNALFFGDYAQGFIQYAPTDGAGNLLVDGSGQPIVNSLATDVGPFVDLAQGPDGFLYFIDIIAGKIQRIRIDNPIAGPQIEYEYYEGAWSALPDFDSLVPVATGITGGISVAPRLRDDDFGLRFSTCLRVPETGSYTFATTSDDGSQLFVDGGLVVDNDGLHGSTTVTGSVNLSAGIHPLIVTHFERTGGQVLEATWSGPSFSNRAIRSSDAVACDAAIAASPDPVGFGEVLLGSSATTDVVLTNSAGQAAVQVETASTSGGPFTVTSGLPVLLGPGESTTVQVSFAPSAIGPANGTLTVGHSGVNSPLTVDLSGAGADETNTPPTLTIVSPVDGQIERVGTVVSLEASAGDAVDGVPTVTWTGTLHHGADHIHPNEFNAGGLSASFTLEDHADNAWIEVCATATDSEGESVTECVDVFPALVDYTFNSDPSGLQLSYSGETFTTPFTVSAVIGADRTIVAPVNQNGFDFVSWSIGGAASQTISIGDAPTTVTATYTEAPISQPPTIVDPGGQNDRVGDTVTLQIEASDPDGGTVAYSASGLPDGLTIDPASGLISGSPTTTGRYRVDVTVTDDEGESTTIRFNWKINRPKGRNR